MKTVRFQHASKKQTGKVLHVINMEMQTYQDVKHRMTRFTFSALKNTPGIAGAAVHNPGCSILPFSILPPQNSPQRPGEKIRAGAEQLRRRSLDNHGHLGASGPISLSSLSLSLAFPPVVSTAELHRFSPSFPPLLLFADGQKRGESALRAPGLTPGERWAE